MSSLQATTSSSASNSNFDELRWIMYIRRSLDEELEEETEVPVCIFNVPKPLMSAHPECYIPQLVALGPYHYWRPELYEMERYKLAAAKTTQKQLQHCLKFHTLVDQLVKLESRIRACYLRYLDFNGETLAWMMAIDASFLLEFLQIYALKEGSPRLSARMSHLVDYVGRKSAHNAILRDVVMLENQIPLFILRKVLQLQCSSSESADDMLASMLRGLCQELSPFKMMENLPNIDISKCCHVLDFLYDTLVPKVDEPSETDEADQEQVKEDKASDPISYLKQMVSKVWNLLSKIRAPLRFIKAVLLSRPVRVILTLPWKILSNLPGFSILSQLIEYFCFSQDHEHDNHKPTLHQTSSSYAAMNKPPLLEEIAIPSVAELTKSGVRFLPTNGNVSSVSFDVKTVTLYLPKVSLDINTEVVLRNMVAYEASNATGPLVFTRYTELMNGIVDSGEDVKLLRERGIILNHLKSDDEGAELWNGMSKSIRLTKVAFMDKVIEDVNSYYDCRWSVKARYLFKHYVYGSWQFLTLLAATMLLVLMTFDAFCSVYRCHVHTSSTPTE